MSATPQAACAPGQEAAGGPSHAADDMLPAPLTVCWPAPVVLAMNAWLMAHPSLDVQRWFEDQVAMRMGAASR